MGSSPSVDNSALIYQQQEADRARAEEDARQLRIAEGMNEIAAIFDGGSYAAPIGDIDVIQTTGILGGPLYDAPTAESLERGEATTYAGMAPVLDSRRTALEGYYYPQLQDKHADASEDLTYALARAGQLTSSTAGERQADLSEMFALNQADIDSQIQSDVIGTESRINQQRQSLEAALRASGDQTASSNNALAAATTFREDTPELNPLGNIFAGIADGIGAIVQGYNTGRVRSLATPNPLGSGTGQIVR